MEIRKLQCRIHTLVSKAGRMNCRKSKFADATHYCAILEYRQASECLHPTTRKRSHALTGTREVALGDFQHLDDGRADIRLRTTELRARRGLQLDERALAVVPPCFHIFSALHDQCPKLQAVRHTSTKNTTAYTDQHRNTKSITLSHLKNTNRLCTQWESAESVSESRGAKSTPAASG